MSIGLMHLFLFGLGYSAKAVLDRLGAECASIAATVRDPARASALRRSGLDAHVWDGDTGFDPAVAAALGRATHVLASIAPDTSPVGDALDPVLAGFADTLATAAPLSIVYLSTIGVYGDHEGRWVDEDAPPRPVNARSIARLDAEAAWTRFCADSGIPVAILRLSGIYGPGRGPFAKLRSGKDVRLYRPGQVFNRIHVDDIARAVVAAFARHASGVFNVSDDEPAAPWEVTEHACRLLGQEPPPLVDFETADLSEMARSFWGEVKRIRNDRMKRELGVALRYPTYREGLAAILAVERATGTPGRAP